MLDEGDSKRRTQLYDEIKQLYLIFDNFGKVGKPIWLISLDDFEAQVTSDVGIGAIVKDVNEEFGKLKEQMLRRVNLSIERHKKRFDESQSWVSPPLDFHKMAGIRLSLMDQIGRQGAFQFATNDDPAEWRRYTTTLLAAEQKYREFIDKCWK